ncbi:hypothetical protein ACOTJD_06685 [Achromobacter xylosoxidans]
MSTNITVKGAALASALTELTATGKLSWTMKTKATSIYAASKVDASYYYEAELNDDTLLLYDITEEDGPIGLGRATAIFSGRYHLSIIKGGNSSASLVVKGEFLTDLYRIVQQTAGNPNSVLDGLIEAAKRLR